MFHNDPDYTQNVHKNDIDTLFVWFLSPKHLRKPQIHAMESTKKTVCSFWTSEVCIIQSITNNHLARQITISASPVCATAAKLNH